MASAGNYRLHRHDGFAYLADPVVETIFSDGMQLAVCPTRKATSLLVYDDLLPLLNAMLCLDLLDLIQGKTSPKTKCLVFCVFCVVFFMFSTNILSHMGGRY